MSRAARIFGGLASTLLVSTCVVTVPASASPGAQAPTTQPLASLRQTADVFSSPDSASTLLETVSATRPITREQTVLPVLATAVDATGATWLDVLLPGRPNSHDGWISGESATVTPARWTLTVQTSTRRLTARLDGRVVRRFKVVVGKPSTPTPVGRFFVEESIKLTGRAVGAPYALALSARSNVLQEFAGGPGQIAFHGTNNVGGILGTAASHGCIRLDTPAITWLADHIPPGTPVRISL